MVASVALGIVDDDTIHFIGRFKKETESGKSAEEAIDGIDDIAEAVGLGAAYALARAGVKDLLVLEAEEVDVGLVGVVPVTDTLEALPAAPMAVTGVEVPWREGLLVLSGRGSTTVWNDKGDRITFEWKDGALFAIPLNCWHQHFNGSGSEPARFVSVTNAPPALAGKPTRSATYRSASFSAKTAPAPSIHEPA